MKTIIKWFLLFFTAVLLFQCSKTEIEEEYGNDIILKRQSRIGNKLSGDYLDFFNSIEPIIKTSELNQLDESFIKDYGEPDFENIVITKDPHNFESFIANVGTFKNGKIKSIFLVRLLNNTLTYEFRAKDITKFYVSILNEKPQYVESLFDSYLFDLLSFITNETDENPNYNDNDVVELNFSDCFTTVAATTCGCSDSDDNPFDHSYSDFSTGGCTCFRNPPSPEYSFFDPSDCPHTSGVNSLFLQTSSTVNTDDSGSDGGFGSNSSATKARYYEYMIYLSNFFDI